MSRLSLNDLLPETNYAIRIRAISETEVSEWSTRKTFTTTGDMVNPAEPTGATWVVSGDSFHGEWNSVGSNVAGDVVPITRYEVELVAGGVTKIDSVPASTGTTKVTYDLSFEMNRALFGNPRPTVTFRVRAVDNKNLKSAWTTPTLTASNPVPAAVTGLNAIATVDAVEISWTGVADTDLDHYEVYVGTSAGFTPAAGNQIFSGVGTRVMYRTSTYSPHYFKVRAVDKFNQASSDVTSGPVTPQSPFIVDTTPPATPTGSVTTGYDGTRKEAYLDITWTAVADTDLQNYTIRYGPATGGPWNYVTTDKDVTSARIWVTPAQQYYIGLRAVDFSGNYSGWGAVTNSPINAGADTTAPAQVTGLAVSDVGTSFVATWTASTANDLKEYEIGVGDGTTEVFYRTTSTRFEFPFEMNRAAFGTPKASVNVRVRAVDLFGNAGSWSSTVSDSNPAPAAPTALTATTGANSITIRWTAPADTDVVKFNIYQGTSANPTTKVADTDGTVFATTTNTTGQYFVVKSVDAFGQESAALAGGPYTATNPFLVDTTAPAVPTSLAATITNNADGLGARASLTWTNGGETDRAGIEVSYKRNADTVWSSVVFGKDQTSAIIELQYAYTAYDFRIRAFDNSANYSAWSATLAKAAVAAGTPATPTALTAMPGRDSILFRWNANTEADLKTYELQISTASDYSTIIGTYQTGTAISISIAGLSPSTTYYARVRAINTANNASAYTTVSTNTTAFPTGASSDGYAPSASPTPTVVGGLGYVYATWSPVTTNSNGGSQVDPVTYEVHLSTSSGFVPGASTLVTEVNGTFALIDVLPGTTTALTYGTTYYVKLIAKDRDGAAAAGNQGSASPTKAATTDIDTLSVSQLIGGTLAGQQFIVGTSGFIQSANYGASTGWRLSNTGLELNDDNSSVKAEAIKAGTLGGASGSGVIQIAAGTSLVFNGGYLKSNTNTGTNMATAETSGTGFYLGNDGLFIGGGTNGGRIKANALISDTLTSTTITLGAGGTINFTGTGAITATGFSLTSTGLTLSGGSITGAASIDAGALKSGSLVSTSALADGTPSFSINMGGAATFSAMTVRGDTIVGAAANTTSLIRSFNWAGTAGTTGWGILADGSAYFNNITIKTTGTFGGNITSTAVISGGTVRGATLETNSTNNSVIRINSTGISARNASGTEIFFVNGSTGDQTIGGTTTIQGTTTLGGTLTVAGGISVTGTAGTAYIRGGGMTGTASASASGNGYIMDVNGLYIGSGNIEAGALKLSGNGANILLPQHSGFETPTLPGVVNGATLSIDTTNKMFGNQSLKMAYSGTAGTERGAMIGTNWTPTGGVDVVPGRSYILSVYYRNNTASTTTTIQAGANYSTNSYQGWIAPVTMPASTSGWQRISGVWTAPAGVTRVIPYITSTAASFDISIDGVMVEERLGNQSTPSAYSAPGTTIIDAGLIKTGALQSTTTLSTGQPSWSINLNGAASFSQMQILGNTVLGTSSSDTVSRIQSYTYTPGSAGWAIDADGGAEFNNVTVRGNIIATSGNFSGTITSTATIVGGMYQTASSGNRLEIYSSSGTGYITARSGSAAEKTPSTIRLVSSNVGTQVERHGVEIKGPVITDMNNTFNVEWPEFTMYTATRSQTPTAGVGYPSQMVFKATEAVFLSYIDSNRVRIASGTIVAEDGSGNEIALQSKRLHLTSTNPAGTGAGNQPPLRIGNIAGVHLRIDGDGITGMKNDSTRGDFTVNVDNAIFNLVNGGITLTGGTNIRGRVRASADAGAALIFKDAGAGIGQATANPVSWTSSNTAPFHALEVHAWGGGVFDETYATGGTTTAQVNNNGRFIRASSSKRYKSYIENMKFEDAKKALDLESVTFFLRDEADMGENRIRYPGFIAEQAHEIGMTLFVNYDLEGRPDGFRYQELTAAHNMLIKDLHERATVAEEKAASLEARLAELEALVSSLVNS